MERRAFLLSTLFSALAMYLVYQYIANEEEILKRDFGTFFPMVVASRDILQYETVRPTDIEVVRVPAAMVPPGMISDPKDVVDAVAAIPITKGEHVLDTKIISKNIYSGLDTQISQGRRAIGIPVNPKSAVGYMLRPGNRVDLAAHFDYKTQGGGFSEVKVFMQDLLVLASGRTIQSEPPRAVDQDILKRFVSNINDKSQQQNLKDIQDTLNFAKTDTNYQTVTLEVTPRQAQLIVYVMSVFGDSIILLLRHSDDRQLQRTSTTNLSAVMGEDSFYVRGPKAPSPRAFPKVKFYDYAGDQAIPVLER